MYICICICIPVGDMQQPRVTMSTAVLELAGMYIICIPIYGIYIYKYVFIHTYL